MTQRPVHLTLFDTRTDAHTTSDPHRQTPHHARREGRRNHLFPRQILSFAPSALLPPFHRERGRSGRPWGCRSAHSRPLFALGRARRCVLACPRKTEKQQQTPPLFILLETQNENKWSPSRSSSSTFCTRARGSAVPKAAEAAATAGAGQAMPAPTAATQDASSPPPPPPPPPLLLLPRRPSWSRRAPAAAVARPHPQRST